MKKVLIIAIVMISLFGCSNNKLSKEISVEQKIQIAKEYIAANKHHKAIPYLQDIAFERTSSFTAEAQMLLGESYFAQNKFTEARFEYEELIRLFNDYSDVGSAYFKIGVCYYEESLAAHYTQEETSFAIDAFQTFIEKFPFSTKKIEAIDYIKKCNYKLLEKNYFNGYAYYTNFDYSAALMYFDEVIELGNVNQIDKLSLYYAAKIYEVRKDKIKLQKMYDKLNEKYPNSKETKELSKFIK